MLPSIFSTISQNVDSTWEASRNKQFQSRVTTKNKRKVIDGSITLYVYNTH